MSEGSPRRGTTSALRSACVGTRREESKRFSRGPGTRPSLGPSTRARQSSLNFHRRKSVGGEAGGPASRSGKPAQAGGTGTGVGSNGRCATRLVSTLVHNESRVKSEKAGYDEEAEGGCGLRPRETRELRFGSPHVVRRCRNRQATPGPKYARQTRPKKDGQGRVNGGLGRGSYRRVKASVGASGEKANRESDSPEQYGGDRRKAHGDVRASSSGRHIAQAVGRSRDRGCNGHRILRRVPVDGRHLGLASSIVFHDSVQGLVWRLFPLHHRSETAQKARRSEAPAKAAARVGRMKEGRQRCQRLDGFRASWEENAHAGECEPRGKVHAEIRVRVIPSAEAVSGVVKTPGPPTMPRRALISAGRPRGESRGSGSETREVRVHVFRMGGRSRLDASRVFCTGRSQGLVVSTEGTSPKEVRSTL